MKINGFVLAGGKSSRMGRDKALLDWHGRTLLEHMTGLLAAVTTTVQVVGGDPLPDRILGRGPLGGILTALEVSETDANLVVAVDLPMLTVEFLKYFRSRFDASAQPVLTCKIESRFPLCIGLRRRVLPDLRRHVEAGALSVQGFITNCDAELIEEKELRDSGFDPSLFRNINTEEDYRKFIK